VPADPRYGEQWHHPLIRSPEAWDVTTGVRSTVIAVVDSGVDLDHPDLAGKIWTNPGEIPNNGKDDDGNGFIDDVHGWDFYSNNNDPEPTPDGKDNDGNGEADDQVTHGTLVAGLAAAASNTFGTVGVNWKARVMPIQVFPDDGGTAVSTVVEGMDYAIAMHADVINLSLGGGFTKLFNTPIQAAYQAGITVVVASGNAAQEFTQAPSTWASPACNDGPNVGVDNYVLGVGATDQNDRHCSFSNFDSSGYRFVDVSAPGQAVFGPGYQNDSFPAFQFYFAKGTGTSFSSPIVAGLAALVKAHEPGATNAQIIERIRRTTDNTDGLNPGFAGELGTGRINAARALGVDLPPAPVRNLRATDTSGDQGGSATLRWLRSTDDGGGAQDVTEYIVKRSGAASGPFTTLASVPAGADTYADTGVANHVDYYYVVTTRDAAGQTTDSDVAGPAQARDDTPPPAVQGVAADDLPNDPGGAIRVAWTHYAAPADFAALRVYRARFNFVTVSGLTPIATLADPDATSYEDATTTDGVDYWYAVTAVDGEPNEITDVTAVGPVQSFPNQGVAVTPGLHFMATPIVPTNLDPAAFFGTAPQDLTYARFDPAAQGGQGRYIFYHMAPASPLLLLGLGKGFWFHTNAQVVVNPVGDVAASGPFGIDLEPGWRQLGNPFLTRMDFTTATVEDGSVTMDLASAEAAGIMRRFAWAYDPSTGDYVLIDRVVGGGQRLIAPWEGFWVYVMKPCRLVLDRESTTVAALAASPKLPKPRWQVQLVARGGGRVDAANYVGVAAEPERLDVEAPPAFGSGVRLDLRRDAGGRYAATFRKPSAGALEWTFTVDVDAPGEVIVAAPDLSPVPPEYGVVLTDLDARRQVQLRTVSSYRYTAESAGERHFRLTVKRDASALAITSLAATPLRGGGTEVRFALTSAANCDVEVLNVAGRPIRRLIMSEDYAAGQQVILWSGRTDTGVSAPNGTYLIRVRARSVAGSVVHALSSATILR
jgi:subtilisin family serine protease